MNEVSDSELLFSVAFIALIIQQKHQKVEFSSCLFLDLFHPLEELVSPHNHVSRETAIEPACHQENS